MYFRVGISDDYMVSIEKDKLRSWRLKGKYYIN